MLADAQGPLGARIFVAVVLIVGGGFGIYIMTRSLIALRKLPRKRMSPRERRIAAIALPVWAVCMGLGALIGASIDASRLAGAISGIFAGAFTWLIGCWTVAATIGGRRRRRAAS